MPGSLDQTDVCSSEEQVALAQDYTVEQVARILHVGRDKVYFLLRTGQLESIKTGRRRRITERQLADFIASVKEVA